MMTEEFKDCVACMLDGADMSTGHVCTCICTNYT